MSPWVSLIGADYSASLKLAQEFLASKRPEARREGLRWTEMAELFWHDFREWCDAHPDQELVKRQEQELRNAMALWLCTLIDFRGGS